MNNEVEYEHQKLTEVIIGSAMNVLDVLKPGLDEKLYENALVLELRKAGCRVEQQKAFEVHYQKELIGKLVPDLIINEVVIVDPKVVSAFNENHIAQMIGYLSITHLKIALLLNFKFAKLKIKRVIR